MCTLLKMPVHKLSRTTRDGPDKDVKGVRHVCACGYPSEPRQREECVRVRVLYSDSLSFQRNNSLYLIGSMSQDNWHSELVWMKNKNKRFTSS